MSYKFIYTQEYLRPLRAVLVDIRYDKDYPTVSDDDLFYCIEDSGGSLAGILILTVNNTSLSCVEKFIKIRTPFENYKKDINNDVADFIQSNNWMNSFIFYTPEINIGTPATTPPKIDTNILYGFNGNMEFSPRSYSDTELLNNFSTIPFKIIRYPGGGVANEFNWHTGKRDDGTGSANTLTDLKNLVSSQHCDVLFVLNMLTHTMADQLAMLAAAYALSIPIKYVELGNEFNNLGNPGHIVFPLPQDYFDEAEIWRDAIKIIYPSCLVSFIGENRNWSGGENWNDIGLTKNPDALTLHEYSDPDFFAPNGIADIGLLEQNIITDYGSTGMDMVTIPIWVTEYNWKFSDKQGDNFLTTDSQILTTLYMTQKLSALINSDNSLIKLMCAHNIVGKEGAFGVTENSIMIQPTGIAMQEFLTGLNV